MSQNTIWELLKWNHMCENKLLLFGNRREESHENPRLANAFFEDFPAVSIAVRIFIAM